LDPKPKKFIFMWLKL